MPALGLVFDVILLGALGAAMYRAFVLSRQFEQMRADRAAFEQLISALNIAAGRAEEAVENLREAAQAAGDALQAKTSSARALEGELEIILQAGDSLAERLQTLAQNSRTAAPAASAPAPVQPAAARAPAETALAPRTRAEKELLDALKHKNKSGQQE